MTWRSHAKARIRDAVGDCLIPQRVQAGNDLKQAILDCTFEVLAQSAPTTTPSALVRIAGSAFCFGDDGELATAAHMFEPVLGGRFEVPYVRDRAGHTCKVESVVRYSMPNDFVTFRVAGPAATCRSAAQLEQ